MTPFDFAQLDTLLELHLGQFLLIFFRVAAFFMVVPIFGNQLVLMRSRILLALLVTVALFPAIDVEISAPLLSVSTLLVVVSQVLIGIAMGVLLQIFFHIFVLAGQMIAMQMGLGFASMIDPSNGVSVAVVSQIYVLLVTLLFLAFDGHLTIVSVLAESFYSVSLFQRGIDSLWLWELAQAGSWLFASAVLLAIPAVAAILIVNIAFGIMTRAAPQLNIFSLGFPFTLVFGIFILWASLAGFLPKFETLTGEVFAQLSSWIAAP